MYNGIGLPTPRGSGTNGYVQRNLAFVSKKKEDFKPPDLKPPSISRKPNKEILEHERKRKIELKCVELEDLMEQQGYGIDEINKKVHEYRENLMIKYNEQLKSTSQVVDDMEKDVGGRIKGKGTHEAAMASKLKDSRFRNAFNIGDDEKNPSDVFDFQSKNCPKLQKTVLEHLADEEKDEENAKKLKKVKKAKKSKKHKKRELSPLSIDDSTEDNDKKKKHKKAKKNKKKKSKKHKKDDDFDSSKESGQISETDNKEVVDDKVNKSTIEKSVQKKHSLSPLHIEAKSSNKDNSCRRKEGYVEENKLKEKNYKRYSLNEEECIDKKRSHNFSDSKYSDKKHEKSPDFDNRNQKWNKKDNQDVQIKETKAKNNEIISDKDVEYNNRSNSQDKNKSNKDMENNYQKEKQSKDLNTRDVSRNNRNFSDNSHSKDINKRSDQSRDRDNRYRNEGNHSKIMSKGNDRSRDFRESDRLSRDFKKKDDCIESYKGDSDKQRKRKFSPERNSYKSHGDLSENKYKKYDEKSKCDEKERGETKHQYKSNDTTVDILNRKRRERNRDDKEYADRNYGKDRHDYSKDRGDFSKNRNKDCAKDRYAKDHARNKDEKTQSWNKYKDDKKKETREKEVLDNSRPKSYRDTIRSKDNDTRDSRSRSPRRNRNRELPIEALKKNLQKSSVSSDLNKEKEQKNKKITKSKSSSDSDSSSSNNSISSRSSDGSSK